MRRASTCLAVLGLVVLGLLPAVASAEEIPNPVISFKAKAIPIPKPGGGTYAGTGNFYGKGAAVEAEYSITGTGYGATPQNPAGGIPPISQRQLLPAGRLEDQLKRIPDLHGSDSQEHRPDRLPERVGCQPARERARRSDVRDRTSA